MLKGVNKHIVEINNPNNEYFDKAILFIKANKLYVSEQTLNEQAKKYLNTLGKPKKSNFVKFIIISGLIIVLALLILCCFYFV